MGASDYNQDLPPVLSRGTGKSQSELPYQPIAAQKHENETWAAVAFVAVILIVIVAAHLVAQHRRKIARAANAALISGLATGVRAARGVASKKNALIGRILAKADEKPSQQD